MIRSVSLFALFAVALQGSSAAQVPEAIYTFQGDIGFDAPGSAFWGGVQVGDPFTIVIGVSSLAQTSTTFGDSYGITRVSVDLGGTRTDGTFDIVSSLNVVNDTPTALGCGDSLFYSVTDNQPAEYESFYISMYLSSVTCPTLLTSSALPMTAELPALEATEFGMFTADGLTLWGSVDTATVTFGPVPADELCNGGQPDELGCGDCVCTPNPPEGTIGGCTNSSGRSARLHVSGSSSISAPDPLDLRFEMTGGTGSALALLVSGDNLAPQDMANPCFGQGTGIFSSSLEGLRCVVGNTRRQGGRQMDANGDVGLTNNGWGGASAPPGGIAAQSGYAAGQVRYFQAFYREVAIVGCGTGLNTTQAVRVTFAP